MLTVYVSAMSSYGLGRLKVDEIIYHDEFINMSGFGSSRAHIHDCFSNEICYAIFLSFSLALFNYLYIYVLI